MKKETFDAAKAIVDRIALCRTHEENIIKFLKLYDEAEGEEKKQWQKGNNYDKFPIVRNTYNGTKLEIWHLDPIDVAETELLKTEKEINKLERQLAALKD